MRQTAMCALILALGIAGALATRTPLAAAATYCNLGTSGQSCAEFPIVTHWVVEGGVGHFDLAGTDADPRRLMPPSTGPTAP